MELADLIAPNQVVAGLRASEKPQLLRQLAQRAGAAVGIAPNTIFEALAARETLGSTGVGQGIAMPHARIPGLKALYALFARVSPPIDFAAIDERKVDLIFLLLSPAQGGDEHLAALACASRRLRDAKFAQTLRSAKDEADLYRLLIADRPA